MNTNIKYERGCQLFKELHGELAGEQLVSGLKDIAPDMVNMIIEWGFGEIMARKGLDLKIRELITIAALTTLGHATPQLSAHIEAALKVGVAKQEIVEVLIQMAVYAGFPAAINAIYTAKEIFNKMQ